jgi:hypothetical protein
LLDREVGVESLFFVVGRIVEFINNIRVVQVEILDAARKVLSNNDPLFEMWNGTDVQL